MASSVQGAIALPCLYMQVVFCCYIGVQNIQYLTFKSSYNMKNWKNNYIYYDKYKIIEDIYSEYSHTTLFPLSCEPC